MAAAGLSDVKVPHGIYAEKENRAGRREAMQARAMDRGEASAYTERTQDENAPVRDEGESEPTTGGKFIATN